MAEDKRYRIAHEDGRSYDVTRAAFNKIYEGEGFKITANADGTALEAPKVARATSTRSRSAAAKKGAATRAARREAAAAASSLAIDSSAAASDEDEGESAEGGS